MIALAEMGSAYAACVPEGTPHGDTIVCSGTQTEGVAAKSGDDSISVLLGASISLTVQQSATAIDAGSGNDSVVNEGIISVTVTPAALAPAATSASCSAHWNDAYGLGTVLGIGIAGGGGSDLIDNRGAIGVQTSSASGSGAVKLSAVSIGILGDSGNDRIGNGGSITVGASSDAGSPQASAKGIAGVSGDDFIVNSGTITVTATATVAPPGETLALVSASSKSWHDSKPRDDSQTASATAVGIEGGSGKDKIDTSGALNVSATASLNSFTPTLTLSGGDDVDASTTLDARAVGIAAGGGRDQITNNGALKASATATVDTVAVEGNLIDLSHANTSTTVSATAIGIDGGSGSDKVGIGNAGTVEATATSRSKAVAVEVNLVDAAVSDATLTVNSRATGIDAGTGHNQVDNAGSVKATATSTVSDVGVNASFVDATVAEGRGSNLSTTLNATAVGIDGRKGKDDVEVTSTGSVEATATADAHSVGVSLASEGVPGPTVTLFRDGGLASIGISSNSVATGIATGDFRDRVNVAGDVTATATSTARQESINVGVAVFDFKIPTPGLVLGSAGTGARADALGIDTGGGNDVIQSDVNVQASATATAAATTVSVNLAELSVDLLESVPGIPFGASLVVADTVTTAESTASGIRAGAGDDSVTNNGAVRANANATSGSTSASATLNTKFKEGDNFFTLNAVAARATTTATATAAGIDAGSGDNIVSNAGNVTAEARADANTVSVTVDVAGTVKGAGGAGSLAATDTSSTGTATATGVQAGDGDDKIVNTGTVQANATADVDSVGVAAVVGIAKKGVLAGVGLTRAQSNATATATGVDGGGGKDQIENAGTVAATAKANADAVGVTVKVEGATQGVAAGAALADTATTANATAVGIRAGAAPDGKDGDHGDGDREDHDHKDFGSEHDKDGLITNANAITVDVQAKTLNVGAGIDATVAKEGVAIGAALADGHSTSQATAKGIEGNGDANAIGNTGSIGVKSDASSTAVSVSVTVEGTATGLAAGAALARADVNATSSAAGIDGGAGDDRLSNDGSITVEKSKSAAIAVGVAPDVVIAKSGVAIGGALADTRAVAGSTATAMDGGAGDDKLTNRGTIAVNSTTADSSAVSVSIGVAGAQSGITLSGALVDSHARADATGLGMAGGDGRDALVSTGSVTVDDVRAGSDSVGVGVGVTFSQNGVAVGAALARSGTEANATGKALDGGDGKDLLYAEGSVTVQNVKADATAVSVSVGASGAVNGLAISAGLADASGKATASASGLDGGADDDTVVNRATVKVQDVNANATAVGVTVALAGTSAGVAAGVTLVDSSGTATTTAKGIDGGAGDDHLWNKEALTVQRAKADANSVSTGVTLGVAVTGGVAGGAALSKATATGNANATGMDGGSGDDSIGNVSSISLTDIKSDTDAVSVSVQLGVTTAGVALGAALADTSTTANTTAKGMDGGSGNDFLYNGGSISLSQIKADASAVSVGVTGNLAITGGVAAGAALTGGGGTANVTAIGMDGGSGRDTLVNTGSISVQDAEADAHATGVSVSAQVSLAGGAGGAALTKSTGTATTVVKGIDGGADDDTIVNKGSIDVHGKSKADATSVDVTVAVALGVGGGAQMADISTTAETTATGIDGGSGRNTVGNEGPVTATAEAESQSTSVGIGITIAIGGDATIIGATSTATATATGINDAGGSQAVEMYSTKHDDGNHGDHEAPMNEIGNTGAVTATATATSGGVSVSGNLAGYGLGKTTNTATANATGIKTGDARDAVKNEGAVTANSSATASGVSVAVSLAGKAMGDASSTATATATAIDTGAGDDQIENLAALGAYANSQASATGVSVGLAGVSAANAATTATATATGLSSGSGDDQIANHSTITATAGRTDVAEVATSCNADAGGACARVSSVSVTLAGKSSMNASTTASAAATGIAAGADDDAIDSDGAISVSAHAKTGAGGANVNIAGAASTNATTIATATATGIAGEDGNDTIRSAAGITAKASSDIVVDRTSVTVAGAGSLDATLSATARATAIDGGAGRDKIHNEAALSATAAANLSSGGGSTVIFGASGADSDSGAIADAAGIRGGANGDLIWNEGTINAKSSVGLSLGNSSFTFGGAGGANGTLTATSRSTGIAGDDGHDAIYSSSTLTVDASSVLNASGGSTVVFGASSGSATSGASTTAIGIDGGAQGDGILLDGSVVVTAGSQLTLSGSSFTFGGAGGAGGSLSASTFSTGVAGGGGADAIGNKGSVSASATSNLNAAGGSKVVFGASTGGANAGAITDARGIDGGDDDDFIHNSGTVSASATATLTLSGGSFTFGGSGGTQGSLTATTLSTGIAGGAGQDFIKNEGEIHSTNTSTLNSSGGSDVGFGSSGASSSAGAVAIAAGIDGGDGDDFVWNSGSISVISTANLTLGGSSYTFGGTGDVGGRLNATTRSAGIQGGNGSDFLGNEGSITVDAKSTLSSNANVNTTFGTSASGAVVGSDIGAAGIDGGAGDDAIKNLGTVTAKATASVDSGSSAYVFGGTTSTNLVAQAGANSAGLRGGDGKDFIFNSGEVTAEASSTATSAGSSYAEFGGSAARGEMAASAVARGVDGGAGDDVVVNLGTVSAKGTSSVSSTHSTETGFLFGGGDSRAAGSTTLSAFGIDAGDGDNTVANKGAVNVDLFGSVSVSTYSDGADIFDGDAFSQSDATVTATAVGIRAGDGNDVIENEGSVDIKTWRRITDVDKPTGASADAIADGDGIDGDGTIISKATTKLTAVGIDAGNGNNRVENHGTITINARAFASATGRVDADAGGTASATLQARVDAQAVGIRTGAGDDTVINTGTITTATDNTAISGEVNASATGIEAGDGNNTVINKGTITTASDNTAFFSGNVNASATGIQTGAGNDYVINKGTITTATDNTASLGLVNASATGIEAGAGNNTAINKGTITVTTAATNNTAVLGLANASATGIEAGAGNNTAINMGTIAVTTTATNIALFGSVNASATGIQTGAGNATVINKGAITVATTATNAAFFGGVNASATGIQTGPGNDTIVNQGTITATTVVNGVSSRGTAIDAGAGDDKVTLTDGSVTNGNIDLGSGSNQLVLQGTPVISGTVIDGSSGLALVFNAAGSFGGALPGVSATKNGPGTFTLPALNRMQRIEVNQGTLKLDSDYTFLGSGMFQAKVNGNGGYGQFYVNGQAALDGTIKIVRGGGAYVNGTSFDVLVASNGIQSGTAFSRVESPDDTRLLKFHTEQVSDGVRVKADVASFTTAAGTPNQMAVAGALDRILPKASGTLSQLLGKIQALPDAQFASAFASMSPAVYAGYTASTFNTMQQYATVLQDRMTALRAGDFPPARAASAWGGEPIRLAYAGKGLSELLEASEAERARSSGLWLRGFSQKGDQNPTGDMSGFDYRMAGTSIGYDGRLTDSLSVGVSFGTARNHTNVDSNVSQGDIDTTMGSIYAGYFNRRLYLNGMLSAGRNKYDTSRTLLDQSTASSSHGGDVLAAAASFGSYVQLEAWWLEPFVTVQYTRLKEEGFSETGSSANQIVEGRSTNGLVSTLGARFSRPIQDGNGALWLPQASLAWLHDYSKTQVINASYIGAPDSSFSIEGQPVQRNGALVGLGLSYRAKGGFITTFQYTGEFRDQFRSHGLSGEFRFEF